MKLTYLLIFSSPLNFIGQACIRNETCCEMRLVYGMIQSCTNTAMQRCDSIILTKINHLDLEIHIRCKSRKYK